MARGHKNSAPAFHAATAEKRSTLKWCLPFFAAFLPIVLISLYSYRIASGSMRALLQTEHISATSNLMQLLTADLKDGLDLVNAVSSVPGTIDAVKRRDQFAIRARLKAVTVAYPQVDRAYVTYPDGVLWEEHPQTTSIQGLDLSRSAWYIRLSKDWKPHISGIYQRSARDKPAIAIVAPIRDGDGAVLGILVFEYPTTQIVQWLRNISLSHDGYLLLVDQDGTLVAHPDSKQDDPLYTGYREQADIQEALRGTFHMSEYTDPLSRTRMIATFQPVSVGKNLWVVIAQQPVRSAYAELNHVRIHIGLMGAMMTIFTLAMVIVVARIDAKNVHLNRKLQEINLQLRELASIVHYSSDAIIGLAFNGTVTSWNRSAEKMYGYSEKEMIGHSIAPLIPENRREEMIELLKKIQNREGVEAYETERVRRDGTHIPVSVTISTVDDGEQTAVVASSIDRDITEQKEIEQIRNDFISFVSHQLKAPVTGIRWILEQILDGDFGTLPPELREAMLDLRSINADNYHLITDILNASRIERGVIAVDLQPVSLQTVAEDAVRDYRQAAEKAGLSLGFEDAGQEITVLADREKAAEAVANAISNAVKYTQEGGITICLRQEGDCGIIEVRDTGRGIPPEIVKKLFTRNQILGGSASPERSTGLGLYIAKKFMEIQGGSVTVESTVDVGSTFTYRIPLAKSNIDEKTSK